MTFDAPDRDGLILSSDYRATHPDLRPLARAARAGDLVKLRRGAFVRSDEWSAASAREQHILRIRAVAEDAQAPIALAGFSAAALHGMPVFAFPDEVQLQESWKGGGRSMPGVKRISAADSTAERVAVGAFHATDIARTALELTRQEPFARAVGSMDWALWRRNEKRISKEHLIAELAKLPARFGVSRAQQVVRFATHLSDSYGESMFRAIAHEYGFEAPRLQREIRDQQGLMVPDYSWDAIAVLGEFDGKDKYLRSLRPGEQPGDAVWREKVREDRLRALGFTVVRFTWADLMDPKRVVRKLLDAGVPRRRS